MTPPPLSALASPRSSCTCEEHAYFFLTTGLAAGFAAVFVAAVFVAAGFVAAGFVAAGFAAAGFAAAGLGFLLADVSSDVVFLLRRPDRVVSPEEREKRSGVSTASPSFLRVLLTPRVEFGVISTESHEDSSVLIRIAVGRFGSLESEYVVFNKLAGAQLGSRCGCVYNPVGVDDLVCRRRLGIDLYMTHLSGSMSFDKCSKN